MSKPFSSIRTSGQDIVMEMLSVICHASGQLSPYSLLKCFVGCKRLKHSSFLHTTIMLDMCRSRHSHGNAISYMSKHFFPITTSSHGIVMKMLTVIGQSLSPP
jgi:hypothetical protein